MRTRQRLAVCGAAATVLRGVAAKAGNMLPLHVERHGKVVLLTNAAPGSSSGSGSLTDDQAFKDALAAAEKGPLPQAALDRLSALRQAFSGEPR